MPSFEEGEGIRFLRLQNDLFELSLGSDKNSDADLTEAA